MAIKKSDIWERTMKVRELQELLSKLDPEDPVRLRDIHNGNFYVGKSLQVTYDSDNTILEAIILIVDD